MLSNLSLYLIFIIFGLIIGSFLNVVILRFDDLASVISGRSHCPKCKKVLSWYELIPVLSYIFLMGKCRQCKKEISFQYPLVEAATALIFALLYGHFGLTSVVLYFYMAISAILMVIFVYDIQELEISDWLVIAAGVLWILYLIIDFLFISHSFSTILFSLYGGLGLGGFLFLLVAISREKWMGAGDVGLGLIIGLFLGWPNVISGAFFAFLLGGVLGMILILAKSLKMKDKLPFAPFLILGFFVALFWGEKILTAYFAAFMH